MQAAGIYLHHETDSSRPTTNKNVFVASGYRLLKVDTVDNRSISDRALNRLAGNVVAIPADIVLFSDFRHGIFNRDTIPRLIRAIPKDAFRVADSQVASRWGNILDFKDFDLITPNEREARFALGDQDSVIRPLASRLYEEARCKTLILKMGDRGVLTQCAPVGEGHYLYVVPSFVNRLVDAVGAGDALLAYASLARKATGSDLIASILGSIAAAIECERNGNIPVSTEDVLARLGEIERDAQYGPLNESTRSIVARPSGTSRPSISRTKPTIVEALG
jgi:sugar/nucleoside kinase (ribokinase family)